MTLDYVLEHPAKEELSHDPTIETEEEEEMLVEPEYHESHLVKVGKQRNDKGLTVSIDSVDFRFDSTEVFIKIENETGDELGLYITQCYAVQNKRQVRNIFSRTRINNRIPSGVIEEGVLSFDPIDYRIVNVVFYLRFDLETFGIEVNLIA